MFVFGFVLMVLGMGTRMLVRRSLLSVLGRGCCSLSGGEEGFRLWKVLKGLLEGLLVVLMRLG